MNPKFYFIHFPSKGNTEINIKNMRHKIIIPRGKT